MDGAGPNLQAPRDYTTLQTSLLCGGATLLLVLAAFFVLNYFNVVSLSEVFPSAFGWLPHLRSQSTQPKTSTLLNGGLTNNPAVKSAVVYYRIEGTIKNIRVRDSDFDIEINEQTDKSLPSKLTGVIGNTTIRQYGSDTLIALKDLKPGDTIELVYTQDTNTGGGIITQIAVHR